VIGVVAGGAWGAAIQAFTRPRSPRLSVIGDGASQLALLDTGGVRTLVMLGPPTGLLGGLSMLMTSMRQRIDLVVGTDAALVAAMGDVRSRWNVRHTFAIPDGSPVPYLDATTTRVSADLDVDVAATGLLSLRVSTRDTWRTEVPGWRLWAAMWEAHDYRVALAPDAQSARILVQPGPALIVVPQAEPDALLAAVPASALAINRDNDPPVPPDGVHLVRIYPSDVAEFGLGAAGVTLPSWAT
jgi:hypothetical protein